MEDKIYKFIHEQGYDKTNCNTKNIRRFIVIMLSICVLIDLTAVAVLIHFTSHIKNNPNLQPEHTDKGINEKYNVDSSYLDEMISQAVEDKAFSMDDYKEMYEQLKEIAKESAKYIVTVCTGFDTKSWQEGRNMVTSGMIVNKSSDIIIITDLAGTITSGIVRVTFFGGETYDGKIIETDEAMGIAAVKVDSSDMEDGVYNNIEAAKFAAKDETMVGESIIVLGNPYGKDSYAAYGNITSLSNNINIVDGNCHLLTTDINEAEYMNGFVINLAGRVIGIVNNTLKQKSMKGIISALVIWDAQDSIENIIKGKKKAYLGIKGEDITDEIIEIVDDNMPYGVYVKDVVQDLPAYNSGILNGDIIVSIDGHDVKTMNDIMSILATCRRGQEISVNVMRHGRDEYKNIYYKIFL